jgi:uncharacterized membrane protein
MELSTASEGYLHRVPRVVQRPAGVNVSGPERVASTLVGVALAALGLGKRGLAAVAAGLVGGLLIERGVSGKCPLYTAVGRSSA